MEKEDNGRDRFAVNASSPEPQDVRVKGKQAFDTFAAAFDHESNDWLDMGVNVFFVEGYVAALAQSDVEPTGDNMEISQEAKDLATEILSGMNEKQAAAAIQRLIETVADQVAGNLYRAGEVIPDCPTEGVAARQGNGG